MHPDLPQTLGDAAVAVLTTADASAKAQLSRAAAVAWASGALSFTFPTPPPARPARPARPELLLPRDMPKRRQGGTSGNRAALLHAVAHIELNAIDLAWDMVARFGAEMPRAFADDWVQIGDDEARHFLLLSDRLKAYDAAYGDLPAHDGLWQAAEVTAGDLMARLAVVPLVLEARGLDVTPDMIERFERFEDPESAATLRIIYEDEVGHVAAGRRWLGDLCEKQGLDPVTTYQDLVRRNFRGALKPPFNVPARDAADFPQEFYEPLSRERLG
ncbi:ferritin-like domain-containing protein [Govanella unica]|uniref:Ferritin-like domain-containing protein n=1 Tax=Govanella unica TaxID=2975056 RepID=A0A9X3Z6W6_9PROT|nr:ferritin-like domain-containing protein [Govania unica]